MLRIILPALLLAAILPAAPPTLESRPVPLEFEPDQGQGPMAARFLARGPGYQIRIEGRAATFLQGGAAISMSFLGSTDPASLTGTQPARGVTNIYHGNPRDWRVGIPHFSRVRASALYPGIDVEYYGQGGLLEYDLILAPGVDPASVRLSFSGVRDLQTDSDGNLLLISRQGTLRQRKPVVYQGDADHRTSVNGRYRINPDHTVTFALDPHDSSLPLVIDPVLEYSSYLNSGSVPGLKGKLASNGDLILAGSAGEFDDFPTLATPAPYAPGQGDIFIMRTNSTGSTLVFATLVGGAAQDILGDLTVTPSGSIVVVGQTYSSDFPTSGAFQPTFGSPNDAFVTQMTGNGAITWSSFLGGASWDQANGVAADASGNVYVTGTTDSSDFPFKNAYSSTNHGSGDAFVAKIAPAGSLVYSTLLGGSGSEFSSAIAVDGTGAAYVAGTTSSSNFPLASALQSSYSGDTDGFLTKVQPAGNSLAYSTYLGGANSDYINAIAVDASNSVFVAGYSGSPSFPSAAPVLAFTSGIDAFVAKLNPAGSGYSYFTYLGGSSFELATAVALEPGTGAAIVGGYTFSPNFPAVSALQTAKAGLASVLWKSNSSGTNFAPSDTGLGLLTGLSLVMDPTNPAKRYLQDYCSVYRSTDSGASWTAGGFTSCASAAMAHHPAQSGWLLLGGANGAVRSTDGGLTFSASNTGLPPDPNIASLSFDPQTPGKAFAAIDGQGLFVSNNGGQNWSSQPVPSLSAFLVSSAPSGSAVTLLATRAGLYRILNSVPTLTLAGTLPSANSAIAFAPSSPDTVYFANYCNLYASADRGSTWSAPRPIPGCLAQHGFTVDPASPTTVYAAVLSRGLIKSTDGGQTWTSIAFDGSSAYGLANSGGELMVSTIASSDGFVTRLTNTGTVSYSTYLGSANQDSTNSVAVDAAGAAWIFGDASESFPVTPDAVLPDRQSGAFVAKITTASPSCIPAVYSAVIPQPWFGTQSSAGTIRVTAPPGCAWSVDSPPAWITLGMPTSSQGIGVVTFTVAGAIASPRSGTLTVSYSGGSTSLTVRQTGASCTYGLSQNPLSAPGTGGPISVTVTTGAGCFWTNSANVPWLVPASTAVNSATGTVSLTVQNNPLSTTRSGKVTLGTATLTVNQLAGSQPAASITPSVVFRDMNGSIRLARFGISGFETQSGMFGGDPASGVDPITGDTWIAAPDSYGSLYLARFITASSTFAPIVFRGGHLPGSPALAVSSSGTAWIAVRDSFGGYYLLSQTTSGPGPWIYIGGIFATDPTIALAASGTLYLVGRDNYNGVWVGRYDTVGESFAGWTFIGGIIKGQPAVTAGTDNALYIAARDSYNGTYLARYAFGSSPLWVPGGGINSIDPQIAANGAGMIYVTTLNSAGGLYYRPFVEGAGANWQPWAFPGGVLQAIAAAGGAGDLFVAARYGYSFYWYHLTGDAWTGAGRSAVASALSAAPR